MPIYVPIVMHGLRLSYIAIKHADIVGVMDFYYFTRFRFSTLSGFFETEQQQA